MAAVDAVGSLAGAAASDSGELRACAVELDLAALRPQYQLDRTHTLGRGINGRRGWRLAVAAGGRAGFAAVYFAYFQKLMNSSTT